MLHTSHAPFPLDRNVQEKMTMKFAVKIRIITVMIAGLRELLLFAFTSRLCPFLIKTSVKLITVFKHPCK